MLYDSGVAAVFGPGKSTISYVFKQQCNYTKFNCGFEFLKRKELAFHACMYGYLKSCQIKSVLVIKFI